jgi:nicotinamidase-related amidase
MSNLIRVPAYYYRQFNADFSRDVPEEGFGGWKRGDIEIAADHTAVAIMHAWDCGEEEQFPGWRRAVPHILRATEIAWRVFPALLAAVRQSPLPLIHIAGDGDYYKNLPGYIKTRDLAGPAPDIPECVPSDPVREALVAFKQTHAYPGQDNLADTERGRSRIDFAPEARPLADEPVVEDSHQLLALCKARNVNHLIYAGFAINSCLVSAPGGMVDMHRHGILCSVIRDATTAVEMAETARDQIAKELALWRVSIQYGFVFESRELINALNTRKE